MNAFMTGFVDELVKLGAGPLEVEPGFNDYSASVAKSMADYAGAGAKVGLKGDPKVSPPPAVKALAPQPKTTPNELIGRVGSG